MIIGCQYQESLLWSGSVILFYNQYVEEKSFPQFDKQTRVPSILMMNHVPPIWKTNYVLMCFHLAFICKFLLMNHGHRKVDICVEVSKFSKKYLLEHLKHLMIIEKVFLTYYVLQKLYGKVPSPWLLLFLFHKRNVGYCVRFFFQQPLFVRVSKVSFCFHNS